MTGLEGAAAAAGGAAGAEPGTASPRAGISGRSSGGGGGPVSRWSSMDVYLLTPQVGGLVHSLMPARRVGSGRGYASVRR